MQSIIIFQFSIKLAQFVAKQSQHGNRTRLKESNLILDTFIMVIQTVPLYIHYNYSRNGNSKLTICPISVY